MRAMRLSRIWTRRGPGGGVSPQEWAASPAVLVDAGCVVEAAESPMETLRVLEVAEGAPGDTRSGAVDLDRGRRVGAQDALVAQQVTE